MLIAYFHVMHMSTILATPPRATALECLLANSREFGKSVDWLLTGEEKKDVVS
jgi:hypothetical protein